MRSGIRHEEGERRQAEPRLWNAEHSLTRSHDGPTCRRLQCGSDRKILRGGDQWLGSRRLTRLASRPAAPTASRPMRMPSGPCVLQSAGAGENCRRLQRRSGEELRQVRQGSQERRRRWSRPLCGRRSHRRLSRIGLRGRRFTGTLCRLGNGRRQERGGICTESTSEPERVTTYGRVARRELDRCRSPPFTPRKVRRHRSFRQAVLIKAAS